MISDSERREVARRLRELPGDSTYPDLIGVIADRDGWYPASDAADRLADLIEPTRNCGECDRDALLRLSDEIYDTSCDNHGELTVDLIDIWGWAQAICEAVGE